MHHHLDVPELGEDEGAFLLLANLHVETVLVLLEGETVVAQAGSEAGIARLLSIFHTPEKAVKGPIYPLDGVLQYLRVDQSQFRAYQFTTGQFGALMRVAQGLACHAVGIPAFLQRRIVDFATEGKPLV